MYWSGSECFVVCLVMRHCTPLNTQPSCVASLCEWRLTCMNIIQFAILCCYGARSRCPLCALWIDLQFRTGFEQSGILGCGCAVHKSKSAFICKCESRFCVVVASYLDELYWVVHASLGGWGRQWNWSLVAQRQIWWVVWQAHRHVFPWHLVPEPSV